MEIGEFLTILQYLKAKAEEQKRQHEQWKRTH